MEVKLSLMCHILVNIYIYQQIYVNVSTTVHGSQSGIFRYVSPYPNTSYVQTTL